MVYTRGSEERTRVVVAAFRVNIAGKLHCLPGELSTLNDWENHLGTLYPEVGLLYDEVSLQNVLDMIADWTPKERQMLRDKVPKTGLKTRFRDGLLKQVSEDVVKFAKDGLERRGFKESGFLNEAVEIVRTGVTPAEKLLELYNGKWKQQIDPIFEELLY